MEVKKSFLKVTLVLLMFSFGVGVNVQPSKQASSTIVVPDDYSTIQAAINAANTGDTIAVRSGTYPEGIVVNKTVSLIGENKETTVILGANLSKLQSVILIEAGNVTVSRLKILNSTYQSIWVKSSDNTIKDNIIEGGNWAGIFLDGRTKQTTRNTIINNYIVRKYDCGILVWNSSFNLIRSNIVTGNGFGIYLINTANKNIIAENQLTDNLEVGVSLDFGSSNNIIVGNNISDNGWGGSILMCGIYIANEANSNQLVANSIVHNKIGINLKDADYNKLFHNNFVSNSRHTYDYLSVGTWVGTWDNGYPSGGNFWSNYTGIDVFKGPYQNVTGSDGIGDTPHIIDDFNTDKYPLMSPYNTQPLLGDINYDLKVDMRDLAIAGAAFGSYPGLSKWNPMADVNQDARVDIRDLVAIAKDFGKTL